MGGRQQDGADVIDAADVYYSYVKGSSRSAGVRFARQLLGPALGDTRWLAMSPVLHAFAAFAIALFGLPFIIVLVLSLEAIRRHGGREPGHFKPSVRRNKSSSQPL
jgi:hypothetical protein